MPGRSGTSGRRLCSSRPECSARITSVLRDDGCAIVVMDREPGLPADVHCFWDLVEAASDADNDVELDTQADVPVLRFTGGTTGRGKCAMYTIDNWAALRDSAYIQPDFDFNESTRYLALTPLSHAGLIPFLQAFYTGGATYTLNGPDLNAWCEVVQCERITHALLVPTLLYRLLDLNSSGRYDLSSLSNLTYGAAPMAPAAVERLIEQIRHDLHPGLWRDRVLDLCLGAQQARS